MLWVKVYILDVRDKFSVIFKVLLIFGIKLFLPKNENPKFNDNRSLFNKEGTYDWLNQSADLETVSLTFFEQFWQLESNKNCECKYEIVKKKLIYFSWY